MRMQIVYIQQPSTFVMHPMEAPLAPGFLPVSQYTGNKRWDDLYAPEAASILRDYHRGLIRIPLPKQVPEDPL